MRSVSSATCTSGEPVSLAARWYCLTTCAFCAACKAMFSPAKIRYFSRTRACFKFSDDFQPLGAAFDALGRSAVAAQSVARLACADAEEALPRRRRRDSACPCEALPTSPPVPGRTAFDLRRSSSDSGQAAEQLVDRQQHARPAALIERLQVSSVTPWSSVNGAGSGPPQRRQVRAAAQRPPDILGQGAHVGSFAAHDAHLEQASACPDPAVRVRRCDRAARAPPRVPARASSYSGRPSRFSAEYIGGICSISPRKPFQD